MSTTSLSHSHEQASHAGSQAMPLPSPKASPRSPKGKQAQAPTTSPKSTPSFVRTPPGSPPTSPARSEKSGGAPATPLPNYQASQDDYAHVRGQAPASPSGGLAPSPKQFAKEAGSHSTPLMSTRRAPPAQAPAQKKASLLSRLKGSVQGLLADRSKLFQACMLGATFMLLLALATSNPTLILFGVMMMTMGICGLVSQDNAAKSIPAPNPQQAAPDGKSADAAADKKDAMAEQLRQREAQAEHAAHAADEKRQASASHGAGSTPAGVHHPRAAEGAAAAEGAPAQPAPMQGPAAHAAGAGKLLMDEAIPEDEARRLQPPLQPNRQAAAPAAKEPAASR